MMISQISEPPPQPQKHNKGYSPALPLQHGSEEQVSLGHVILLQFLQQPSHLLSQHFLPLPHALTCGLIQLPIDHLWLLDDDVSHHTKEHSDSHGLDEEGEKGSSGSGKERGAGMGAAQSWEQVGEGVRLLAGAWALDAR